jgi:hypothetical protein
LENSVFPVSRSGFEAARGLRREIPARHGRYWTNRTEETEEREVLRERERESVKVQRVKDEKNKKKERKNKKA